MNGGTSTTTNNDININDHIIPSINVWEAAATKETSVSYVVRHPWQWVMADLAANLNMEPVDSPNMLPLARLQAEQEQAKQQQQSAAQEGQSRPTHRRNRSNRRNSIRRRARSAQGRASLRLEVIDTTTGRIALAVHGTSACFEGLGDKDELVRTMQRCRCDHLHLSPPSILIQWDVTQEECYNVVGRTLPRTSNGGSNGDSDGAHGSNTSASSMFAVLKEPMGSQGKGIFFVQNAEEIHQIIDENHRRASEDPDLLENLIADKGRIPSWVLQAEVYPSLLIRSRRKFHIRSYVVVVERSDDEVLDMYIYGRHEVRIAGLPVVDGKEAERDRNPLAHITNGALSNQTERVLLDQVPELLQLNIPHKLELFVAQVFATHLLSDISRRIGNNNDTNNGTSSSSATSSMTTSYTPPLQEFSVAGLDIMITEDLRLYLLEVNVNPAAPPKKMCDVAFAEHLHGFFRDLVNLVTLGDEYRGDFHDAFDILEREQQQQQPETTRTTTKGTR